MELASLLLCILLAAERLWFVLLEKYSSKSLKK